MKKMEEAQMKIKRDSECLTFCRVCVCRPAVAQLYLPLVCISKPFGMSVTSLYAIHIELGIFIEIVFLSPSIITLRYPVQHVFSFYLRRINLSNWKNCSL